MNTNLGVTQESVGAGSQKSQEVEECVLMEGGDTSQVGGHQPVHVPEVGENRPCRERG